MTHIIDLVSERITARYINKTDIDRNEFNNNIYNNIFCNPDFPDCWGPVLRSAL